MSDRFRAASWVGRGADRYPAVGVDGSGAPVPRLSGDLGHLVGTGLLSPDEERLVAGLLLDGRLASGFGLRSAASDDAGFRPTEPRRGAVAPVDTAIAIEGLLRAGFPREGTVLALQLERAADALGGT
ncbi:amylo-alpha-1,6-glucosidase, partial [Agrococcus sp. HG114]|nr:amylo-alpha-1,6-glucosidase [Agrococcus sp. HG114]